MDSTDYISPGALRLSHKRYRLKKRRGFLRKQRARRKAVDAVKFYKYELKGN